jgi:hypothetical protein
MWRLLSLTLALPVLFILLALNAVQVGASIGAPPSTLAGLDDCVLPCWRNIIPRTTPLETAEAILLDAGYQQMQSSERYDVIVYSPPQETQACNVGIYYNRVTVVTVTLSRCQGLRLGDLLAILGSPEGILRNGRALTFRAGTVIASTMQQTCEDWFSPHQEVFAIYLNNPGPQPRRRIIDYTPALARSAFAWHGFASRTYYQSVEPDFPICG